MTTQLYASTGTLSGASGTVFTGSTILPDQSLGGSNKPRAGTLSAQLSVTAATSSLAVYLKWEVSHDNSTWIQCLTSPQNAAPVALVTGTSTVITRSAPAPDCVYGYKYARASLYSAGATGTGGDAVGIGYVFSRPTALY